MGRSDENEDFAAFCFVACLLIVLFIVDLIVVPLTLLCKKPCCKNENSKTTPIFWLMYALMMVGWVIAVISVFCVMSFDADEGYWMFIGPIWIILFNICIIIYWCIWCCGAKEDPEAEQKIQPFAGNDYGATPNSMAPPPQMQSMGGMPMGIGMPPQPQMGMPPQPQMGMPPQPPIGMDGNVYPNINTPPPPPMGMNPNEPPMAPPMNASIP